jgi:hypothetical protein
MGRKLWPATPSAAQPLLALYTRALLPGSVTSGVPLKLMPLPVKLKTVAAAGSVWSHSSPWAPEQASAAQAGANLNKTATWLKQGDSQAKRADLESGWGRGPGWAAGGSSAPSPCS